MATEIFLGEPPANIKQWIIDHATPPGPAGHADTWYKYAGDTEWRTVSISGEIYGEDDYGAYIATSQIPNINNVVAIDIGTDVSSIGYCAFPELYSLDTLIIPSSVKSIGWNAFYNTSPNNIYADNLTLFCETSYDNPYAAIFKNGNTKLYINNVLITDLIIPDGITSIGEYAFYCCNQIRTITIPNSVSGIGPQAFDNCGNLMSITIPDSVESIGYQAFASCRELSSVTIIATGKPGASAATIKDMLISAGVPSSITWNMPS